MKNRAVLLISLLVGIYFQTMGQPIKVLFVGNSYTGFNDLASMVYDVSLSTGDTLYIDKITPGGYRFLNHSMSTNTLDLIADTSWNYVVLQAQSQEPSWPLSQVQTEVFPHATILCDAIRNNNSCGVPVFYMTWGRKNGDASNCGSWPPVCTYDGMDSLLSERYQFMAEDNNALVSPVGAVWHYIRDNYPLIELYNPDESHPSVAGSYAAACTFYAIILRKDPSQIMFNAGLSMSEAVSIRNAAKIIAFDDLLNWNVGKTDPVADFSFTQNQYDVNFMNLSVNGDTYNWTFGDGNSSTAENPQHTYLGNALFPIELKTTSCGRVSTKLDSVVLSMGVHDLDNSRVLNVYPNPSNGKVTVEIEGLNWSQKTTFLIIDNTGKIVTQSVISGRSSSHFFDSSSFPTGLYYINVIQGGKRIAKSTFEVVR
ncbi:MAG: hypothetical protein ACI9GM_000662 [Salibacteraceae bacterium]|jgi:hypothetical protein